MHSLLLERTAELIDGCPCESGCPSCVGPEGQYRSARQARRLLDSRATPRDGGGLTVDLSSRLRAIVRPTATRSASSTTSRTPAATNRRSTSGGSASCSAAAPTRTDFGDCLVIDRRYESDRWHGEVRIGDCELTGPDGLRVLDPHLAGTPESRALFIDLETTGISGGAGTVAFLVGVGFFDLGAFQVRQFLLTSYAAERALLTAVSELFDDAGLIVSYNGKTFDVPVMETRWVFHRMEMSLEGVPHFDMLHPARRLWRSRGSADAMFDEGGCRLTTLERALFEVRRVGDVPGFEIPGRFFQFLRTGDPRPLEPVLEHNRLDLVSLAAVTARAARLAADGADACRDGAEALALGRIYERAEAFARAEGCYRRAAVSENPGRPR